MKHLTYAEEITKHELETLFLIADKIKKNPQKFTKSLRNKVIATLFYEPSTRTRCSFETAALRLGAGIVSTENARENASTFKGETLEDTIKVLSGYVDAIIMRHHENDAPIRAAAVSSVPLINAGSGSSGHPTQSVLDAFTIRERKGSLDNLKIAVLGDLKYGRTANSLLKLLSLYDGLEVYTLAPKGLELGSEIDTIKCSSINDIPNDVDVIYQTRIQKERLPAGVKAESFTINKAALDKFSQNTLLMHPLPRIDEITADCDSDPRAIYFHQAHNGVPIRMALLLMLLKGIK